MKALPPLKGKKRKIKGNKEENRVYRSRDAGIASLKKKKKIREITKRINEIGE